MLSQEQSEAASITSRCRAATNAPSRHPPPGRLLSSYFFFLLFIHPVPCHKHLSFLFFSFYRWNRLPSSFLYLYVLVVRPAHRRIVFQSGAVGYKKIEEREKIRRESRMHSLLCEENTSPSLSVGRKTKNEKWRKRTGSRIVERKIEWH